MKIFYTLLFFFFSSSIFSQTKLVTKNIEVGAYIQIAKCKPGKSSFESMDLYTKTRFPDAGIKIDSVTGDGIYESFFAPGDFDAKRLPASYGNKKYKIATIRTFEEKNGKERRVIICYTKNKLTMIWIEFEKAMEAKEIEF